MEVALGCGVGLDVVDALIEIFHIGAQALNLATRIGVAHRRLSVSEGLALVVATIAASITLGVPGER